MVTPQELGVSLAGLQRLKVDNAEESREIILSVLSGEPGPARDIVVLNAGAAIYAADLVGTLGEGVRMAQAVIDSGAARKKLDQFVEMFSQGGDA
jgi:anthranilate phosphoribosyltransferase